MKHRTIPLCLLALLSLSAFSEAEPTGRSHRSGSQAVGEAVRRTKEAQEAMFSEAPEINWIQAKPSTIAMGRGQTINLTINIIGSPARVGRISIVQIGGSDVGTVFTGKPITFDAMQNIAKGTISVVPHKKGTITIEAKIANPDGSYTRDTTTLTVN